MPQFRKKPVVIEAVQWFKNGDHPLDGVGMEAPDGNGGVYERIEGLVVRFFRHPNVDGERACEHCGLTMHVHGWIDTKEGGHIVCPGDWVITGIKGEKYPCKPDIFAATYEPADVNPLQVPDRQTVLTILGQRNSFYAMTCVEQLLQEFTDDEWRSLYNACVLHARIQASAPEWTPEQEQDMLQRAVAALDRADPANNECNLVASVLTEQLPGAPTRKPAIPIREKLGTLRTYNGYIPAPFRQRYLELLDDLGKVLANTF